jgi:phosphatidylglycerophosphate synthase
MIRAVSAAVQSGSRTGRRADLVIGAAALIGLSLVTSTGFALVPVWHAGLALLVYAGIAVLIDRRAPAATPGPGLGAANRVTLLRLVIVSWLAGAAGLPVASLYGALLWVAAALALLALLLDGLDGHTARRLGLTSRFGARFDEEVDAGLIMVLALLVWRSGQVGLWVWLLGLMRYGFVAAGCWRHELRADLPPSFRRKAVCVLQVAVLPVCLLPAVPPLLAAQLAGLALLALGWSFWVDVRWLLLQGRARGG